MTRARTHTIKHNLHGHLVNNVMLTPVFLVDFSLSRADIDDLAAR